MNSIVETIFIHAEREPEKLCLADDTCSVSYTEFADKIRSYAGFFESLGLKKSDVVVVESSQTVEFLAVKLALELIGIITVPVEFRCSKEKLIKLAEKTSAKKLFVIFQREGIDSSLCLTFDYISKKSENFKNYSIEEFPKLGNTCEILFTTGTTGEEKGIVLTHENNIALAENVINGVNMKPDNIELILSPLNHSHGLRRYYANAYMGSSVILLGSVINVVKLFDDMSKYNVNSIDSVPGALSIMLKLSRNKLEEYNSQIRYIQLGGSSISQSDRDKLCSYLPNTRLYNFYGSTESGCTCIYDFNQPNNKKNCIGKQTYNSNIFIVNDQKEKILSSASNIGYLACSGKMNMVGYWKDPETTDRVLKNGVIYSNDAAYIDEDGDIILLGRKGDIINVGGSKVSPNEIEDAAMLMSDIEDCGVIAVDDENKGSKPMLFVQMKKGVLFDPDKIKKFLGRKLELYKIPYKIKEIEKIPRSFNGKLLRKNLKDCI